MRRRIVVAAMLPLIVEVGAGDSQHHDDDGGFLVAFWTIFFILVAIGIVLCLFWGVGWYGNSVHVRRRYYKNFDGDGNVISYGYQTVIDGDADATHGSPPEYGGHAGHYAHAYTSIAAQQRSSQRRISSV